MIETTEAWRAGARIEARVLPVNGMYEIWLIGLGMTLALTPHEVVAAALDYAQTAIVGDVAAIEIDWDAVSGQLCCPKMVAQICRSCNDHWNTFHCPDQVVARLLSGRYGLIIRDGGSSVVEIDYCPWCGTRLQDEDMI